MKKEHRLRYIIKEGILDTFYIWKDELKNVFKDEGVLIFFFLVPFAYPLLYSFIYNNEVVHEAKMVVVDQSDSYLSRELRLMSRGSLFGRIWRRRSGCWTGRKPTESSISRPSSVRICIRESRRPFPCIAI